MMRSGNEQKRGEGYGKQLLHSNGWLKAQCIRGGAESRPGYPWRVPERASASYRNPRFQGTTEATCPSSGLPSKWKAANRKSVNTRAFLGTNPLELAVE